MTVADVDLVEINEAFASVPVADVPPARARARRSRTSTAPAARSGHPVAATGARMIMTTMYELARRGGGIGVASMCAGGGMGSATVFEVYPR